MEGVEVDFLIHVPIQFRRDNVERKERTTVISISVLKIRLDVPF